MSPARNGVLVPLVTNIGSVGFYSATLWLSESTPCKISTILLVILREISVFVTAGTMRYSLSNKMMSWFFSMLLTAVVFFIGRWLVSGRGVWLKHLFTTYHLTLMFCSTLTYLQPRLQAKIFKHNLELKNYEEAFKAILSNESRDRYCCSITCTVFIMALVVTIIARERYTTVQCRCLHCGIQCSVGMVVYLL